ncbi:MAG: hypothetical protein ACFFDS_02695 [Candidatus Thorarchaeota archaeon]
MTFTIGLTEILAFWGSILSSVALTWNIIKGLQDRRKLIVNAYIGIEVNGDPNRKYIYAVITNYGRRPINVLAWGAMLKRERGQRERVATDIRAEGLPKILKEGEDHLVYIDDFALFSRPIKYVYARDSHKKYWKVNKKEFKQFMKDGIEEWQSQNR